MLSKFTKHNRIGCSEGYNPVHFVEVDFSPDLTYPYTFGCACSTKEGEGKFTLTIYSKDMEMSV